MAEMTIQKSQAFPVGKDLNKGKSLEDNKASLDFNAFLRSSKEDTVKNEGDRKSKSQENSEKKTEQNSIEKDPKEAKLQKGEKKTEKKQRPRSRTAYRERRRQAWFPKSSFYSKKIS